MHIWRFTYVAEDGSCAAILVGAGSWEKAHALLKDARAKALAENPENLTAMKLVRVK